MRTGSDFFLETKRSALEPPRPRYRSGTPPNLGGELSNSPSRAWLYRLTVLRVWGLRYSFLTGQTRIAIQRKSPWDAPAQPERPAFQEVARRTITGKGK
jgi:hypothetical protein